MGYYAYEYEVLIKLQNDYKIESISIDSKKYYAYSQDRDFGWNSVGTKTVEFDNNRWITFNFQHNFHVKINGGETILKAFELGQPTDQITFYIGQYIDTQYLHQIKK